mmetsp:Transcript_523/g.1344  ORF Transcript_523/g.1344 Transcript_523/m.1344 type:complete len:211 (-) Transcript_523:1055-1687(-)
MMTTAQVTTYTPIPTALLRLLLLRMQVRELLLLLLHAHLASQRPRHACTQLARIRCGQRDLSIGVHSLLLLAGKIRQEVGVIQPWPLVLLQQGHWQARHLCQPLRVDAHRPMLLLLQQQGLLQRCLLGGSGSLRSCCCPAGLLRLFTGSMKGLSHEELVSQTSIAAWCRHGRKHAQLLGGAHHIRLIERAHCWVIVQDLLVDQVPNGCFI